MKKFMMVTFLVLGVVSAEASVYSCLRDDEADDWVINMNLKKQTLELFDNDSWTNFVVRQVIQSPVRLYIFAEPRTTNTIEVVISQNGTVKAKYKSSPYDRKPIKFSCSKEK